MDVQYQSVQDAVLFAKVSTILDTINRLDPLQFAFSLLLALRQTRAQQAICTDGCGLPFSQCPRWEDGAEGLNWVMAVLGKYIQPPASPFCIICYLPNPTIRQIHPESSIAIDHVHFGSTSQDTIDIFGPGLLLLKQKPVQSAMGLSEPTDLITVDQAAQFLDSADATSPRLQTLFLLCYHLLPTTNHSPDAPAISLKAASSNQVIPLPTRSTNDIHINRLSLSAVNAAVAAVNRMESLKPVSGSMVQVERYSDGTTAKVTVEWSRTDPRTLADTRQMFAARCHAVLHYLDRMTEQDAQIMFCILVWEHESNLWVCPCGSETFFNSCTLCAFTNEDRKGTIDWINSILNTLPGHIGRADHTEGSHCITCLRPRLSRHCPTDLKAILPHQRDIHDARCFEDLPLIFSPAVALLYRTAVRKALSFPEEALKHHMQVSQWLATPWPAIPSLSTIHRLYFLHYFLLPTTRHSPLTGGFLIADTSVGGKRAPTFYRGPSEANLTYMTDVEAAVMYAAVESVKPTVTGTRTVEKSALDGSVQTTVSHQEEQSRDFV